MHKGVLLLVETKNEKDALTKVREFLDYYQDDMRDWYQIGGRRTGHIAPKIDEFNKMANKVINPNNENFISMKMVQDNLPKLQEIREGLGNDGPNPYSDHYRLPDDGGLYDVMSLTSCIDIVKEWLGKDADCFSFDSNIYNITLDIGETIPENIDDYMVVVVDLHN